MYNIIFQSFNWMVNKVKCTNTWIEEKVGIEGTSGSVIGDTPESHVWTNTTNALRVAHKHPVRSWETLLHTGQHLACPLSWVDESREGGSQRGLRGGRGNGDRGKRCERHVRQMEMDQISLQTLDRASIDIRRHPFPSPASITLLRIRTFAHSPFCRFYFALTPGRQSTWKPIGHLDTWEIHKIS